MNFAAFTVSLGIISFLAIDGYFIGRSVLRQRTIFSRGETGSALYQIAILQEEPFLKPSGEGFFPEFLAQFSQTFQAVTGSPFRYEIVPVSTWTELIEASRTHLALGLFNGRSDEAGSQWSDVFKSEHCLYTSHSLLVRTDLDGFSDTEMIVVKDSPFEHLLKDKLKYTGRTYTAPSSVSALKYLRDNEQTVFYTESLLAHYNADKFPEDYRQLCARFSTSVGQELDYSFFGGALDSATQGRINQAMAQARTASQGIIDAYFDSYNPHDECDRK